MVAEVLSFDEVQERKRKAAEASGMMVDLIEDANQSSGAALGAGGSGGVVSPPSKKNKPKPAAVRRSPRMQTRSSVKTEEQSS